MSSRKTRRSKLACAEERRPECLPQINSQRSPPWNSFYMMTKTLSLDCVVNRLSGRANFGRKEWGREDR